MAFSVGLIAALLYFYDTEDQYNLPKDKQIASVKNFSNDSRWKSAQQLAWRPLKKDFPLSLGDSLYTGDNSRIEIIFSNQNELVLQSNTLVTLEQFEPPNSTKPHHVELNMSYGQVEMKSIEDTQWNINNRDENIEIKSDPESQTKVEIKKNKAFQVSLKNGKADVLHKGIVKQITPKDSSEVFLSTKALSEIKHFVSQNNSKPLNSEVITGGNNQTVEISPTVAMELVKNFGVSKTDVSDKPQVEKKPAPQPAPLPKTPIPLPQKEIPIAPNYQTSANSPNEEQEEEEEDTPVPKLIVSSRYRPPEAKIPFHESVVYLYKGNKLNIRFIWMANSQDVKFYIIQIAKNDLFQSPLLTKEANTNKIDIELPSTGKFYWKVKSVHNDEPSPWSETKFFTVEYSK